MTDKPKTLVFTTAAHTNLVQSPDGFAFDPQFVRTIPEKRAADLVTQGGRVLLDGNGEARAVTFDRALSDEELASLSKPN